MCGYDAFIDNCLFLVVKVVVIRIVIEEIAREILDFGEEASARLRAAWTLLFLYDRLRFWFGSRCLLLLYRLRL